MFSILWREGGGSESYVVVVARDGCGKGTCTSTGGYIEYVVFVTLYLVHTYTGTYGTGIIKYQVGSAPDRYCTLTYFWLRTYFWNAYSIYSTLAS